MIIKYEGKISLKVSLHEMQRWRHCLDKGNNISNGFFFDGLEMIAPQGSVSQWNALLSSAGVGFK